MSAATMQQQLQQLRSSMARPAASSRRTVVVRAQAAAAPAVADAPLMVRAARGEVTERAPCWMMRQAGRYAVSCKMMILAVAVNLCWSW
jgi:hypothetical protein